MTHKELSLLIVLFTLNLQCAICWSNSYATSIVTEPIVKRSQFDQLQMGLNSEMALICSLDGYSLQIYPYSREFKSIGDTLIDLPTNATSIADVIFLNEDSFVVLLGHVSTFGNTTNNATSQDGVVAGFTFSPDNTLLLSFGIYVNATIISGAYQSYDNSVIIIGKSLDGPTVVSKISLATQSLVWTIPANPSENFLAVCADGEYIYVTGTLSSKLIPKSKLT